MKIDTSSTLAAYQANKTPSISKTSDDAKLKEQTDAFEAILLKFMLEYFAQILKIHSTLSSPAATSTKECIKTRLLATYPGALDTVKPSLTGLKSSKRARLAQTYKYATIRA